MSTPCCPPLPARLAGSLLLPQMPGRVIGSVWPGAVRVGSGFGGLGTLSQARARAAAALLRAGTCSQALRQQKGVMLLLTHPSAG